MNKSEETVFVVCCIRCGSWLNEEQGRPLLINMKMEESRYVTEWGYSYGSWDLLDEYIEDSWDFDLAEAEIGDSDISGGPYCPVCGVSVDPASDNLSYWAIEQSIPARSHHALDDLIDTPGVRRAEATDDLSEFEVYCEWVEAAIGDSLEGLDEDEDEEEPDSREQVRVMLAGLRATAEEGDN